MQSLLPPVLHASTTSEVKVSCACHPYCREKRDPRAQDWNDLVCDSPRLEAYFCIGIANEAFLLPRASQRRLLRSQCKLDVADFTVLMLPPKMFALESSCGAVAGMSFTRAGAGREVFFQVNARPRVHGVVSIACVGPTPTA